MLKHVLLFVAILSFIGGVLIGGIVPMSPFPVWLRLSVVIVAILGILFLHRFAKKKFTELEGERNDWRRGTDGETNVGGILAKFPEDFYVINDLATSFGNLDHVVIGPTGVFVLDSKNWRGVVSADGNGELLLNGQATHKKEVRLFVGRMLGVRDRVLALTQGVDAYYQALFVFTSARVEASWGSTGKLHCIREEKLYKYIVESTNKRLAPEEARTVAQAFRALAHMDKDFERSPVKSTT
ncbi:MAG TPA: nuclease-related domain-containing protein [Opitutaceae bacterium]